MTESTQRIVLACSSAIAVAALFFLPSFAIAQGPEGITLLAPSVIEGSKTVTNAGVYLEVLYKTAIGFAGVLAVMILVWGGFEYIMSGASPGMRTAANARIWAALGGLLLLLASYTILETINPNFVGFDIGLGLPESTSSSGTQTGGTGASTGSGLTQAQAENFINSANEELKSDKETKDAKISVVSSGDCTSKGGATCTSLEGVQPAVLATAYRLAAGCNCEVVITGGTEVGHAQGTISHGNGAKFDVRARNDDGTPNGVTNYIFKNAESGEFKLGKRTEANGSITTTYTDKDGTIYAYEIKGRDGKPHWDITPGTKNAIPSGGNTTQKGTSGSWTEDGFFMSQWRKGWITGPILNFWGL